MDLHEHQFIRKSWSLKLLDSNQVANAPNPTPLYPTIVGPARTDIDAHGLFERDTQRLAGIKVTIANQANDIKKLPVKQWKGYNGIIKSYRNGTAVVEISAPLAQTQKTTINCPIEYLVHAL